MNIMSILQNNINNLSMEKTDICIDSSREVYNRQYYSEVTSNLDCTTDFYNFKLPPPVKYRINFEICDENSLLNTSKFSVKKLEPTLMRQYTLCSHKIHIEFEDKFIETNNDIIMGVPYGWIPVCTNSHTLYSELSDFLNHDIENSIIVWYKEKISKMHK